jgi:hypothetical protein
MKKLSQWLAAGVTTALLLSAGNILAQDNQGGGQGGGRGRGQGGGFGGDPAEFQARMMTNIREQLKVKDDTEWKALEGLVQKVMDARREVGTGGGGFGRMFRRQGGDNNGGGGAGGQGGGRGRGGFGGEPSAEQAALDKAIDSGASKDELKSAMAKVRASKKDKEAKLTKAQDDLKKVLSTEQEAVALAMGLVQ